MKSYQLQKKKTKKTLEHCDIFDFERETKNVMESHIIKEHEDCYCCYLCDKYFETKESMKYHNVFIHNQHYTMIKDAMTKKQKKKHKKKKKDGKK